MGSDLKAALTRHLQTTSLPYGFQSVVRDYKVRAQLINDVNASRLGCTHPKSGVGRSSASRLSTLQVTTGKMATLMFSQVRDLPQKSIWAYGLNC